MLVRADGNKQSQRGYGYRQEQQSGKEKRGSFVLVRKRWVRPQGEAERFDAEIWEDDKGYLVASDVTAEGVCLSIQRKDGSRIHSWRALQRIKNELCGPEREAVEIYPADSRLVDVSNTYHLWVLAEGARFPWGFQERMVADVGSGQECPQTPLGKE